jgi:hypothetical protein
MSDYEYKLKEYPVTLSPKQIEYISIALENLGLGGVDENYFLNDCGGFVLEDIWNQIHDLEKKESK